MMLDETGAVGATAGVVGYGAHGRGLDAVAPLAFHEVAGTCDVGRVHEFSGLVVVQRVRLKMVLFYKNITR